MDVEGAVHRTYVCVWGGGTTQTSPQENNTFLNKYVRNELIIKLDFSTKEQLKYKSVNGHEIDVYVMTWDEVCGLLFSNKSGLQNSLYKMA